MSNTEREFGRNESPYDARDWDLDEFMPKVLKFRAAQSKKWDFPLDALDQKETPHCVGFAMAHFGINLPTLTPFTKQDAHDFYYKCKIEEGEPKQENGTTIRSAAKVLKNCGIIDGYAFARNMTQIKWWLLNKGPVILGTLWTEDMMYPDKDFTLNTGGEFLGGHGFIGNEWREDNHIGIKNSWGPGWGKNGKAYISALAFQELFLYGGEALAAVELEDHKGRNPTCWSKFVNAINKLFN